MPRIARVVAIKYPHHITQRGNYRQNIFINDADREKYLSFVNEESKRYGLTIVAYCLMSNHVHFIGIPESENSMSNVFKYVNMKYSQYFNKKMGASGHLFQGRFFSSVMDEIHMLACTRYIERNPIRAKIIKKPWMYRWSSARVHCGLGENDKLGVNRLFDFLDKEKKAWQEYIDQGDEEIDIQEIREQTRKGRPLAATDFVKELENKLDRCLILKQRGRPRIQDKE